MKTRIIHTKIWKDDYFSGLNRAEKLLFLFLITNENINMCGIYEQNDKEVVLWTGLTNEELASAKARFEQDQKFVFRSGWVKVLNHGKYNSYGNGEKQETALNTELSRVPKDILDTSIGTSMDTHAILDLIPKSKYIKQKEGGVGETEELAKYTSDLFSRTVRVTEAWSKNYERWRKVYSFEEIKKALDNWKRNGWIWSGTVDGGDLVLLFRTKNKAGECDYIGQLLNKKSKSFDNGRSPS